MVGWGGCGWPISNVVHYHHQHDSALRWAAMSRQSLSLPPPLYHFMTCRRHRIHSAHQPHCFACLLVESVEAPTHYQTQSLDPISCYGNLVKQTNENRVLYMGGSRPLQFSQTGSEVRDRFTYNVWTEAGFDFNTRRWIFTILAGFLGQWEKIIS